MSEVFEGDEWKRVKEPEFHLRQRTRAEQQEWADRQYAEGKITLSQYRFCVEFISTLDAAGNPLEGA